MFRPAALFLSALFLSVFIIAAATFPAYAQDESETSGENSTGTAQLVVRIAQLEEQMRRMEGTIEQLAYQNKQLKAELDKSNADTQYRLQALEKQGPAAAQPGASPAQPSPSATPEGDTPPSDNTAAPETQQFSSSRDHYNYAFRLMTQAKYAEAGDSFAAFTRKYPHDPLVGNAFYWLGETYYVRRNYVQAADNFRQGYEAMPTGPKGGDNLLKLAMSLDAMKKDKEACIVLKQIVSKYDKGTSSVRSRAEQEINRIGCD